MNQSTRKLFIKKLEEATRNSLVLYFSQIIFIQKSWSSATFGTSPRTAGILSHIRKELAEIEAKPDDAEEWADVIILAMDGAWRRGIDPKSLAEAVISKQEKNRARKWPNDVEEDKAIEHIREDK